MIGTIWPQANCQGLWHLNSSFTDSSGNGYTLTASGTPTDVAGKWSNCKSFASASSQFAYITNGSSANLNGTGSRSVLCWLNITSLIDGSYIMGKDGSTTGWLLYLGGGGDNLGFYIRGLTPSGTESTPALSTGVWYFIAGVYDSTNSKIKVWVNNTKVEVTVTSGSNSSNTKDTQIMATGSTSGSGAISFTNGKLDEVAFFNKAITDKDIRMYYAWATGKLM